MADIQSNIKVNIDTTSALASIKLLQTQISAFQMQMAKSGAASAQTAGNMQQNLINSLNSSGKFNASLQNIKTTTESFTTALEKNKLSMREYFRYSIASTKSFGKTFSTEFETINKVARERVKDLQTQYIKMGRDANGAMKAIAIRPLTLDMNDLGTKTQIAAQRQQLLNQLLKQGSTNLLNFGKNTQWAGRQLMVGFTIPLSMAGAAAIKSYMQIEKASVAFKRVYGDINTTAKQASDMAKQVQELAASYTKYGVAVADTMDMAAKAAAMGKQGSDLIAQIDQATKLSILGGVDQKTALDTTISLTNAFGIATDQLSGKINFLNSVENQTVLSIEDMTTAIPKAAPVVKQLGGNVEDLAYFLTAMKEGGINASEGANALKSGLASLINPTKASSDFLATFGVNVKNIVTNDKGNLKKTVLDFATALNTLDPLNRAKAIEMMFGKFQFARMSTLLKNVTDQSSQAAKVMQLANQSPIQLAATANKELEKVQSSPLYKFQKALADIQLQIAPIGESILKIVTPILNFATKMLDGFNHMNDGFKNFILIGSAIGGIVAPALLMVVGLVANGAANILKFFAMVKNFFNKTSTASEILGEQTNYLTTEQIKAQAVAASLDQVHQNLRQTFTAEAEAVNILTQSLQKAVMAQEAFAGPTFGFRGKGTKGYATGGIIRGPGTGTSDSIVARLSNGEAVIPAASVARHPDVVNALVSGNIPGFSRGRGAEGAVGKNTFGILRTMLSNSTANKGGVVPFADLGKSGNAALDNVDIMSLYAPEIIQESGVVKSRLTQQMNQWQAVNAEAISKATELLRAGTSPATAFADLAANFQATVAEIDGPFKTVMNTAKSLLPELTAELKLAQQHVAQNSLDVTTGAGTDALQGLMPGTRTSKLLAGNKNRIYQKYTKSMGAMTMASSGSSLFEITGVPAFTTNYGMLNKSEKNDISSVDHPTTTLMQEDGRKANSEATKHAKQAIEKAYEINSPSKVEEKLAQDRVEGTIKGAKEALPQVEEMGKTQGIAFFKPFAQAVEEGDAKIVSAQQFANDKMLTIIKNSGNDYSVAFAKQNATLIEKIREQWNSGLFKMKGEVSGTFRKISDDLAISLNRTTVATKEATVAQEQLAIAETVNSGSTGINGALKNAGNKVKNSAMLRGGIGAGAMTVGMMGSMMPGQIGEFFNAINPLIMVLGMMGQFLPKIAGVLVQFSPWVALATVAVGGLVLGINAAIDANKKAQEKITALGTASDISADKLKSLSTITGVAYKDITKISSKSVVGSADTQNSAKQISDAETIAKNKTFLTKYKDNISSYKVLSSSGQRKSMLSGFAQSLFGQGYSEAAAQAVIDAIQMAAGKKTLTFKVKDINLSTKEGAAGFAKSYENLSKEYNRVFSNTSSVKTNTRSGDLSAQFEADLQKRQDALKAFSEQSSQYYGSIVSQLENGTIDSKKFYSSTKIITNQISKLNDNSQKVVFAKMFSNYNISKSVQDLIGNINDVNAKMMVMNAAMFGINISDSRRRALEDGGKRAKYVIAGIAKDIKQAMKVLAAAFDTGSTGGSGSGGGAKANPFKDMITSLKASIKQSKDQISAFKTLTSSGMSAAKAIKAISDANFVAALAAAKNKKAQQDLIDLWNSAQAWAQKVTDLDPTAKANAKQQAIIDKAQLQVDVINGHVQEYQDAISSLQLKEDLINKTYDERVAALDQIQTLNEQINQQQQDQLDLASALSKGDVSAAAKTAQDIRARAVTDSVNQQKKVLQDAKDAQLKALTTTVNGETLTIQVMTERMAILENQIANINKDIIDPAKLAQSVNNNGGQDTSVKFDNGASTSGGGTVTNVPSTGSPEIIIPPGSGTTGPTGSGTTGPTTIIVDPGYAGNSPGANLEKPTVPTVKDIASLSASDAAAQGIDLGIVRVAQKIVTSQVTKVPANSGWSLPSYLKGTIPGFSTGGMVPKYFASGGWAQGTDTIPAMLTPGEYVIKKSAVDNIGSSALASINNGTFNGSAQDSPSVYNYSVNVNVATSANPDQIAKTVINQIRQIDSQRIRSNRF